MQNVNYKLKINQPLNFENKTEKDILDDNTEKIDVNNRGLPNLKLSNNGNNVHQSTLENGFDKWKSESKRDEDEKSHQNGIISESQVLENGKHDHHRVLTELEDKSENLNTNTTVEIEFQGSRKEFFFNPLRDKLCAGDYVILETENGCDIGKVVSNGVLTYRKWSRLSKVEKIPVFSIRYKAGPKEIQKYKSNQEEQIKILERAKELVRIHNLDMRITEVEWQFDRHRLTIYFLAPQRIDFRDLVKDLAKEYKTRIELRQITNRERARRITLWEGICGRSICCGTFLHNIRPITIEHSRVQQLSANVTKLSGYCGRLKCCLSYEYDLYNSESERFPKLGSILDFGDFSFKLIKFDIFKDLLTFFSEEKRIYRNFSLTEINEFAKQDKILEPKDPHCTLCDGFANQDDLQELLKLQD